MCLSYAREQLSLNHSVKSHQSSEFISCDKSEISSNNNLNPCPGDLDFDTENMDTPCNISDVSGCTHTLEIMDTADETEEETLIAD